MVGDDGKLNWAVILNVALLAVVIIGAWFSTFSNPLNEKFITLERNFQAQIVATEKLQSASTANFDRMSKQIETAFEQRFGAQAKVDDELKKELSEMKTETERRRVEVATKNDLQDRLATTRLEFLAEIKRLDDLMALSKSSRDLTIAEIQKRIDGITDEVNKHEKADRAYDRLIPHIPPKP